MSKKKAVLVNTAERTVTVLEKDWTLEEMQEAVGGYIEMMSVPSDPLLIIWVNEDGRRLALPPVRIAGLSLFGSVLFTGHATEDGDFLGLGDETARYLAERLEASILWG